MRIDISLLSVISAALLILLCVSGNEVSIDSLSIDVSMSSSGLALDIHPTWLVFTSQEFVQKCGGNAFAFGNVIVFGEHMREAPYEEYVLCHERMHIEQFRALSWLIYPAQHIINIEPPKSAIRNWHDPTQSERTMWSAPSWWPYRWSFVSITWGDNG